MIIPEKYKRILLLIVLVVVTIVMVKIVYSPFFANFLDLREQIEELNKEYNTLLIKSAQSDELVKQVHEMIREIDKKSSVLPPNLLQERVILVLRYLQNVTGVVFNNISFSNPVPVENISFNSDKKPPVAIYRQEALGLSPEDVHAQEPEDISKYPENSVIKAEVKVSFTCSYQQLKNLLYAADISDDRIVINDISITGENDNLSGNITMVFWGLVDKVRVFPDWNIELDKGKNNLFQW